MLDEIIGWRHDLHANPELGYELHRMASLVATSSAHLTATKVVRYRIRPTTSMVSGPTDIRNFPSPQRDRQPRPSWRIPRFLGLQI
jgi:hypothetical protein